MQKSLLTLLLAVLLALPGRATVDAALSLSGNTLTVTYTANSNYNTNPVDRWNGQVLTLAYPDTDPVSFSNLVVSGPFTYVLDGGPTNGGDGFYYQKFSAADVNLLYSFAGGASVAVFSVDVTAAASIDFQLRTGTAWTMANNADAAINNAGANTNVFGAFTSGVVTYDGQGPVPTLSSSAAPSTTTSPIPYTITFDEMPVGFTAGDLELLNGSVSNFNTTDNLTWTFDVTPYVYGNVTASLPAGRAQDAAGNPSTAAAPVVVDYQDANAGGCVAEYLLERLPDGKYRVSLVSNVTYTYPDNITSTAQVTLKVAHGTGVDSFTVDNLTSLVTTGSGVSWALNGRQNAPTEDATADYLTIGLTSYNTSEIPYVAGDTVPLFEFANGGRCLGTTVALMQPTDAFAPPNSASANVGCQLSVIGYNQPDVPLCLGGGSLSCVSDGYLEASALLQGAYDIPTGLMHDRLRSQNLLPTAEPYTGYNPNGTTGTLPFVHVGGGGATTTNAVLAVTGADAIVDWIFVELRDPLDPTVVRATRAGLLQRDGDVVDVDGVSALRFPTLTLPSYYVALRHRNHIGVMTLAPVDLTGAAVALHFEDTDLALHGTDATYLIGSKRVLWGGNANADNVVSFQGGLNGPDNDRVFFDVFGDPANTGFVFNHVTKGYYAGDNNLDGEVKFQGPGNDLDQFIFFNIIARHPGNVGNNVNYYIEQQIPE